MYSSRTNLIIIPNFARINNSHTKSCRQNIGITPPKTPNLFEICFGGPSGGFCFAKSGIIAAILIATFLVFIPVLHNGFVDLDDNNHLLGDQSIRAINWPNIRTIFTRTVSGVYIPLTSLSFALEYSLFEYKPFIYHLDNLILHLLNVFLIILLVRELNLTQSASYYAAVLFAIHPIHVESVAWVTERKDVLYAFFFLLALIQYCRYLKNSQAKNYVACLFFALLSILAKPAAVTLPLILWILDWWFKRKWSLRILFDKIPMILFMTPFLWITFVKHPHPPITDFAVSILIFVWSFTFYLAKFFLPLNLSPIYLSPEPVSFFNIDFLPFIGLGILVLLLIIRYRHNRLFIFSLLFYAAAISVVLRYTDVSYYGNNSIVADRFMYIASVGFCIGLGNALSYLTQQKKSWTALVLIGIVLTFLSFKTFSQCQIWKNDISLFTAAIQENPAYHRLYISRWRAYSKMGEKTLAEEDLRQARNLLLADKKRLMYYQEKIRRTKRKE